MGWGGGGVYGCEWSRVVCMRFFFKNPHAFSARFCCGSSPPCPPCLPACLPAASGSPAARLLCRAAQLLTDREMRGGDAGWGHKQGEAEEEKAERESPALEYTATTRRQREGETHTERLAVFFFWGGEKREPSTLRI